MEERRGVKGTVCDGVFFTEQRVAGAQPLRYVHVEISRQNANLFEVKRQMAAQVKSAGGNAVLGFTYGQRSHSWWQLAMPKWDTESWHGEGDAVKL